MDVTSIKHVILPLERRLRWN